MVKFGQIVTFTKSKLMQLGPRLPLRLVRALVSLVGALELGAWLHSSGYASAPSFSRREDLFQLVADEVGDQPLLYLEFGVYQGAATRLWSRLLRHPDSVVCGFDSFEGLPRDWGAQRGQERGAFSTGGAVPRIDDPRVRFFKGWFDQVLPTFEPPQRDVVVLNMDADLYQSTIYTLRSLRDLIQPGTYIYFDEFTSIGNEERAFRDFIAETGFKFHCRGHANSFTHALFQRVL